MASESYRCPSRLSELSRRYGTSQVAQRQKQSQRQCHPIAELRHLMGAEGADAEVYRKRSDDLIRFATGLVGPSDDSDVVSEAFDS